MNFKFLPLFLAHVVASSAFADTREEVVYVKGELRSQDLFKTSNSVTVLDEELLQNREARHLEDVLNVAPNVNFSSGASRGRFIQIRGIGERSEFSAPVNASVGIVVDGINFTGIGLGATAIDSAQMEIFRGPQGTLFGANALAGLINIVGNDASDTFSAEGKFGYGNFQSSHASITLNSPVNENIGWRIALANNRSDGYMENAYLNREDTNNINESSLRNLLQYKNGAHEFKFISYFIDVDNGYDAFSLDNDLITLSDEPGKDQQETFANALHYQHSFNNMAFKAVLSHANNDIHYGFDEDWSYREICAIDSECAFYQYSTTDEYTRKNDNTGVDLRLSSTGNEQLAWVTGLYFYQQDVALTRTYTNNDPNGDSFYTPINDPAISLYSSDFSVKQNAIYGQLDSRLTENLTLSTGLRYELYSADFSDTNAEQFSPDDSFLGGKIALEYDADNHFLYALLSRGYKAGGFNPDPDVESADKQFDSETMWNVEIGDKFRSNNGELLLQAAAFYQKRADVQVKQSRAYTDGSTIQFVDFLDNAAEGKNYGLELTLSWYASDKISLDSNLALLQTEYIDFVNLSHVDRNTETGEGYDMSGRDQAHAPSYQYFLAFNYTPLEQLTLRIELEGKDGFYFSESHNQQSSAYDLVNMRIQYALRHWDLALWGKNLSDETVETRGFYFSHDFGNDPRKFYAPEPYTQKGAPRTFGISASFKY
ncbi:Pesticin receptor [Thalassocella blandensis]|nr:Pesticin receptor [Thalassocella blandensis]